MPKRNADKIKWYAAGIVITILGWSLTQVYNNVMAGQESLVKGQDKIEDLVRENFKEISGLSARIAKVEP